MYYMKHALFIWSLMAFSLLGTGCHRQEEEQNIIAQVGPEVISAEELQESLILEPQYQTRAPLSRVYQSQLNYLIQRNFQYLAAREVHMDTIPEEAYRLKFIEKQELFKAFIKQRFLDTLRISDSDFQEGLRRFQEKRHVQHIFTRDKIRAQKILKELRQGTSFEEIFTRYTASKRLAAHAVDLGYVTFGDLDKSLEDAVYQLEKGEFSGIVPSQYGFHILRIEDIIPNPAAEYLRPSAIHTLVRDVIKNRQADRHIRKYLKQLAGERKIAVNNVLMEMLVRKIQEVMGEDYIQTQGMIPPMNDREIGEIRLQVQDVLDKVLVRFGQRELTVREVLERLRQTPPLQRPYLNNHARLVQAVINMIREDLIVQAARKEGLEADPRVRERIHTQQKYFLAREFSARLSPEYRKLHPEEWKRYRQVWFRVQEEYPVQVFRQRLFPGVAHPDSIFVDPPIPVVLKNQYRW